MIKLSKQADYALQLLIALSKLEDGELLGLKKFSKESTISFLFLQKIVRPLRESGLVKSVQGKNGGYMLERDINEVSIKEVIDAVDGQYGLSECVKKGCVHEQRCGLKTGLDKMNRQIVNYMETLKVSDLA